MDMKYTFTTSSEGYTETWEYTIPVNGAELVSKAVSGVNLCDRCSELIEPYVTPSVSQVCYCLCHLPLNSTSTYPSSTSGCQHCNSLYK